MIHRLLKGLVGVAVLLGSIAASSSGVDGNPTLGGVIIAALCAGIVLGIVRFGPPDAEPVDFDLFGQPFDPDVVVAATKTQAAKPERNGQ